MSEENIVKEIPLFEIAFIQRPLLARNRKFICLSHRLITNRILFQQSFEGSSMKTLYYYQINVSNMRAEIIISGIFRWTQSLIDKFTDKYSNKHPCLMTQYINLVSSK